MLSRPWSQIATNHKMRRQGFLNCRNLLLSQFCDGSKRNFSDRLHSNRGYSPKCRKHVHIKIGPFQDSFLGTSIISFIIDMHTHQQIYQWNNTKMGRNATFHIHVKSKHGYSPKYPEHVFNVIESICHVNALITNCDKSQIAMMVSQFVTVAICDGSKYNFSDWCQLCQKVYS